MEDGQRQTMSQVQFKRLILCCMFLLTTTGILHFEESTAVVGALSSWVWSTSESQLPEICSKTLQSLEYAEAVCPDNSNLTSSEFFNMTDDMKESLTVLRGKTIACVGDSRVRFFCMLIWSGLINQSYQFSNRENHYQQDRVFVSKRYNITLMFYWIVHPYDARLRRLLSRWLTTNSTPQLAMFQFGAHSVTSPKHGANESYVFEDSVVKIGTTLKKLRHLKGTLSIWMSTLPGDHTRPPNWENFAWVKNETGRQQLENLGHLGDEAMRYARVPVWSTPRELSKQRLNWYADVVHPGTLLMEKFLCQLMTALSCFNAEGSF